MALDIHFDVWRFLAGFRILNFRILDSETDSVSDGSNAELRCTLGTLWRVALFNKILDR